MMGGMPAPQKIKYDAAGLAIENIALKNNIDSKIKKSFITRDSEDITYYPAISSKTYYDIATSKVEPYLNSNNEFSSADINNLIEESTLTNTESNSKALSMISIRV